MLILLSVLVGCAHHAPSASPGARALRGCTDRLLSAEPPPTSIATCLSEVVQAPTCADAWAGVDALTPDVAAQLGATCAPVLCPGLPEPRPRLCAEPPPGSGSPAGILLLAELMAAELGRDPGMDPGLLGRIGALLPMGATFVVQPLSLELPTAVEPSSPGPAGLVLTLTREGIAVGERPVAPDALHDALAAAVVGHDAAVILIEHEVSYERIAELLQALQQLGVEQISVGVEAPPR